MKVASAIKQKIYYSRHMQENERLWKKHMTDFIGSGLSKKAYCKKHGVNYGSFFYWIKKLSPLKPFQSKPIVHKEAKAQLIPVKLSQPMPEQIESTLLCTLNLINGCALQIHNEQSLSLILRKMGLI